MSFPLQLKSLPLLAELGSFGANKTYSEALASERIHKIRPEHNTEQQTEHMQCKVSSMWHAGLGWHACLHMRLLLTIGKGSCEAHRGSGQQLFHPSCSRVWALRLGLALAWLFSLSEHPRLDMPAHTARPLFLRFPVANQSHHSYLYWGETCWNTRMW